MANDLGVQFFTDAKAQYESAGKWRWIVVALLAYLYVGLVMPFAANTRDKALVDRQLADSQAAQEALKSLLDAADELTKDVKAASNKVAADLKADLVERFKRLSEAVNKLAALDPALAAGEDGAAPSTLPPQQMQQQMQQQMAPEDPSALAPMSPDLQRIVKSAAPGEVPSELRAYIESELIEPAFKHANEAWATSGVKIAQGGAAEIAKGIAKAKAAAPAAQLDSLGKSVEELGNEAQRLTFKPPADPNWWRTVPGKEASIRSMMFDFDARVGDFSSSLKALQTQTTKIAEIVSKNRQDAAALNDKLCELKKRAKDLQSELAEIGVPLKVIAFELSEIAPLMPLIIAATLAAIAAWTAEGLRRMTLAAGLVGDEADGTAVRTWLHATAGGSRARVAGVELAVAIASVAWVLAAAWNVAALTPSFLTQPILAAIALAVVVTARAHHWRRADEAASAGER